MPWGRYSNRSTSDVAGFWRAVITVKCCVARKSTTWKDPWSHRETVNAHVQNVNRESSCTSTYNCCHAKHKLNFTYHEFQVKIDVSKGICSKFLQKAFIWSTINSWIHMQIMQQEPAISMSMQLKCQCGKAISISIELKCQCQFESFHQHFREGMARESKWEKNGWGLMLTITSGSEP